MAEITGKAMNGEMDFKTALRERVCFLKGLEFPSIEWARQSG